MKSSLEREIKGWQCYCFDCFAIEARTDTAKVTNTNRYKCCWDMNRDNHAEWMVLSEGAVERLQPARKMSCSAVSKWRTTDNQVVKWKQRIVSTRQSSLRAPDLRRASSSIARALLDTGTGRRIQRGHGYTTDRRLFLIPPVVRRCANDPSLTDRELCLLTCRVDRAVSARCRPRDAETAGASNVAG